MYVARLLAAWDYTANQFSLNVFYRFVFYDGGLQPTESLDMK